MLERARALLVGEGGLEARIPGPVALLVVQALRNERERCRSKLRGQPTLAAQFEATVAAVEMAAAAHRRSLMEAASCPREGSASGHLDHLGADDVDTRGVEGWVPVGEAATALGVTARHVRRLVRDGYLDATRPARDLLISTESLDRYLARKEAM